MNYGQIVIFGAKLVFGGIAAFLAILLWSKTRRAGWLCLSSSVLRLCFAVVPALFLITALILIIKELS